MAIHANIITGFLGAGKTTALLHLLSQSSGRTAVLVNEFGKVGIDGEVLSVQGDAIDVVELPQGCICCTLRGDLMRALAEIAQRGGVDRLLIEPTGVAQPADLVDAFGAPDIAGLYDLGAVITVVDPAMLEKLAKRGMPFYDKQIELADVLVANKADLAGAELLNRAETELRRRNPAAAIVRAEHGMISETLLDAPMRTARETSRTLKTGESHVGRLRAFGFTLDDECFDEDALVEAFEQIRDKPPRGATVYRAKGLFRTTVGPRLVEIAGAEVNARPVETQAPRVDFVVELPEGVELKDVESDLRAAIRARRAPSATQS